MSTVNVSVSCSIIALTTESKVLDILLKVAIDIPLRNLFRQIYDEVHIFEDLDFVSQCDDFNLDVLFKDLYVFKCAITLS